MLTPHRLLDLNFCVIKVSSIIIKCLLERGSYSLEEILKYCKNENEEINEQDITLSVSFLYLIGHASYDDKNDLVKLVSN